MCIGKHFSGLLKLCACACVCVCVPIYLCMFVRMHPCEQNHYDESSLHVKSKSELKSVLNFQKGVLCSEVVSFQRSEIRVWRLSSDFVNYLSFGFYRHLATEKQ